MVERGKTSHLVGFGAAPTSVRPFTFTALLDKNGKYRNYFSCRSNDH